MNKQVVPTQLTGRMKEIRQRFSVRRLSVFGSVVRGEAVEGRDVDVPVAFDRKATFVLFMDLKFCLEELLRTGVDLVTDKALRPQTRRTIEQEMADVA